MLKLPDLLDKIIPSVVQIITPTGQGTGFVLSEDGLIITNKHVIGLNNFVQVVKKDGTKTYGQVVASNPHFDFAALYVNDTFKDTLKLADSSSVRLGEDVVAIGHPYGYDYTISQGIVSSLGRKDVGPAFKDVDFFQLDMGINPGNSGGPVVRRNNGEVIGMVTLGLAQGDNIGFAVPSSYSMKYMESEALNEKDRVLNYIYCSSCGNMNEGEVKYCNRCGASIQKITLDDFIKSLPKEEGSQREKDASPVKEEKQCPSCGTMNKKDVKYCLKCGTTLS